MPAMSPNPRDIPMRKLAYLWGDDCTGGFVQKAAFPHRKLSRAAFSYMERWLFKQLDFNAIQLQRQSHFASSQFSFT